MVAYVFWCGVIVSAVPSVPLEMRTVEHGRTGFAPLRVVVSYPACLRVTSVIQVVVPNSA